MSDKSIMSVTSMLCIDTIVLWFLSVLLDGNTGIV